MIKMLIGRFFPIIMFKNNVNLELINQNEMEISS